MKHNKNKYMAYVSLALAGIMVTGNAYPVMAAEYPTFGQFISGEKAGNPAEESGYTVISLSTEADLQQLVQECEVDSWSRDKYISLENDIILQENREIIIPSFGGIFDGGEHTISGLEITKVGSSTGLFRYVQEGATVRNLNVSGKVSPQGSRSRTGILAGVNYGKIINCNVSGSITGADETGGIVGVNEATGEIRRCCSSAIVTGEHYTGGICGTNRGILNNCTNTGNINTHSTEVTYSLEDITMEGLEDINSVENVAVHTDTGGIAGYSEGKIYYCTNSGTIGYQHVGYNTGGIVGRLHQGYLQNCTNTGHVLGRKDVGGIAGQMEPFLEILYLNDRLSEIDREVNVFFDLLEASHEELSAYSAQASSLAGSISDHLTNASAAAGNLTGTANELWYIYNQELTGINDDLSRLTREWAEQAEIDEEKVQEELTDPGDSKLPDNLIQAGSKVDVESYLAALRRFGEGTSTHLSNITSATNDRSGGINGNLDTLNRELQEAGDQLQQFADVLRQGTDRTSANVDALMAQAKVLRCSINELRDDLFRYEGITVEDASDEEAGGNLENVGAPEAEEEEAYYDTTSFQQGKITLSVNQGTVEADTNVGGIVGQIATEYDFDPEDDISVSGVESFNIEQTVKAVVRESRNLGSIIGKKDYVGGIAGKADFGAVVSCESYGPVSSVGGSYVGGIAGSSAYCIRSCYTMGQMSGKNYVGGIVGKGCDIFYSYAYPELEYSGEYTGSVAGYLEDEGVLYGNYYVRGKVPGVDSIGFENGATPLDYAEFCSSEGVPEAFSRFTVRFQVEGKELASFQCSYGEALDRTLIPEVPEKEGFYGVWPEFDDTCITGNLVLEAGYEKWIHSLSSEEKDVEGRTQVLVQGEFLPETRLTLEQGQDGGTKLVIASADGNGETEQYHAPVLVRALCEDTEHALVEVWTDTGYSQIPNTVLGSYLEFSMEEPGTFRVTIVEKDNRGKIIAVCAAGAVAMLFFTGILIGKKKLLSGKDSS
ncbi:hypothetical protein [Acetatifactor muris]|uniref:hypothetical protein n=1 Tax=Acetatifactor muris TaxID=879566 RepID=UPI0023F1A049|nr:hypothetical protein [Acetatifactor muris]